MTATAHKTNGNVDGVQRALESPKGHVQSTCDVETKKSGNIKEIAAYGDLVLRIEHSNGSTNAIHSFRVSSSALKRNSKYFERLLQPGRFGEAAEIEAKHKAIQEKHGNNTDVPVAELPLLDIRDVGRTSSIRAVDALLSDFLSMLHSRGIENSLPVVNLANLAVVADRFDALDAVKGFLWTTTFVVGLDRKTTSRADAALDEDKVRQRLLVAILLDYPPWLEKYSARLIIRGWVGNEANLSSALWWDLPMRVEDELAYRRECILETIQSVQQYFLGLYTSRERQCKLGYDNSGQCDSFQLGEMVRFFTRIGTMHFQGAISNADLPPGSDAGDVHQLLHSLKQVPEYQIDRFHTHCGIRTRITPLLELLQEGLRSVGICPECWERDRRQHTWLEAKRPLIWKRQEFRLNSQGHGTVHDEVRTMFMATERDWS